MYKLLRSFLFLFDPERVHYFSMNGLKLLCKIPGVKKLIASSFKLQGGKPYEFMNLQFPNRVGLGAGFDKNAKYLNELEALGFGCVEIGTVTPKPQAGNDKPRLFRLPKDKKWRKSLESEPPPQTSRLIIGGNIGKNKITPNEDAWKDYEICFNALHDHVDYFVVNVSSPNTPGLRELQEKDALRKILSNLQSANSSRPQRDKIQKPILLKIAPDLTDAQLDDVIDLAMEINLDGLVATNTTISREGLGLQSSVVSRQSGGLSGLPLKQRSTEVVKYICQKTIGKIPVIASGGIFTGADAKEKIDAGASMVQVWTGFIYEGPSIVKNICKSLIK